MAALSAEVDRGRALITGASAGLGRELARRFAAGGFDLVVVARRKRRLRDLADQLASAHGTDVAVVAMDLATAGAGDRLHATVTDANYRIDALVNNAGIGAYGEFHATDLDRELDQVRLNVELPVHLTKRFLPAMIERGSGTVLNVASLAAVVPGPGLAGYYASKAHLLSLTEAIAEELADTGVTATALCPGPFDSEFHERAGMTASMLGSVYTLDAETVAEAGYQAAMRGTVVAVPGFLNKLLYFGARLTPRILRRKVAARINRDR